MQVNLNGCPRIFPTIILYYKLQIWRESNNFWITTSNSDTEEKYTTEVSITNLTQVYAS